VICPPLTPDELPRRAKERGAPLEIVFFASWCSACKEHLTAAHGARTLVVGTFDKPARIEAVATGLGVKAACFTDAGVAASLGVSSLPKIVLWTPPSP
jgi:hypothetical protein